MLKPLLRTIPTMNGNVKISCELSDYTKTSDTEYQNDDIQMYDCYVRGAFISPLSYTVFDKKLKASLLGGSYDYDLKTFYTYYNDIFYSGEFPYIKTDMEMIDIYNPIYDRNIDFEMGCSRLVDHTGEIEFFAPVYVESYNDIPSHLILELKFETYKKSVTKKIRVNIIRDANSKYNYLSRYLTKYSKQLDNSFINISPTTGQAIYNGIDLTHGGVCDATDNEIGNLFKQQNTINNFDAVICLGYKRNLIVMKQVLPLAFRIDPNNVLSASEKVYYKNATVTICARYYGQNGKEYDFYDWECDYDEYSEKILRMSEMDGSMKWITGNVDNIMDMDYPSLNEAKMIDYVHSNKLTKNYSRWKLKASPEDHPYIINMSIAFSKNQYSNYLYGQYPQIIDPITGLCETIVNETTGNNEYNLILPLGIGNANIYESANLSKYRNILNNYGYNWFDVIYKDHNSFPTFDKWVKDVSWSDVENDETYYNGCLHKLDLLYAQIPNDNVEKIDKFGVFVKANINKVNTSTSGENTDDTLVAMYVLEKNTTSGNCDIYPENIVKSYCSDETAEKLYKLFNTQQNYNLMSKQSRYPDSLSVNGLFYKADNSYQLWTSYSYSDTYSTFSTYSYMDNIRYLNLAELGIYADDLNVWYDGDDLSSTYAYIHNYVLTNSNINNVLVNYQANGYFNANIDLGKDSQLVDNAISLSKSTSYANILGKWHDKYVQDEVSSSNSYTVTSYELLNLHNMGFLLDYDEKTYTYSSKYQLDEDICYLYSAYNLVCDIYVNNSVQSRNVLTYGDTNSVYLFYKRPSYIDGTLGNTIKTVITAYSTKLNTIGNIPSEKWKYKSDNNTMEAEDDNIKFVVSESLVGNYIYKDPIIDELYMSSKEDTSIRNCIGFTYSYNPNKQVVAYIEFDGNSKNIGNSYQYSLFRKGNFVHKSLTDDLSNADLYEDVYNYCNRKDNIYDTNDLQDTTSLSYALLQATYICNDLYCNTINDRIQTRYEFMPAVFQNGVEYANNIFIKKEVNKKQFGNYIPISKIDEDIDVIWVDAYNIQNVLEYYGVESKNYITEIKKFKTRFLNKQHIWWWYAELCKTYDYVRDSSIDKAWCDHIYIKEKAFKTINGKITVVDVYTSLKTIFDKIYEGIDSINIEKGNCINLYSFKQFYDVLENDIDNLGYKFNTDGVFGIELPDYLKTKNTYFELAFDISAIRLDQDIYEKIMQIEDGTYKDLYLYKVESENSWEHKYQNIRLLKPKYTKDEVHYEECGNELVPIFNDIYVQNKKDTEIYANYHLNNLTKVGVYDNKGNQVNTFYKVNAPNISWMYKLSESEFNSLISTENCAAYNEKVPVIDEDGNIKYEVMTDENGLIVRHQTNWFYNHFGKEIYNFLYYKADTGNIELTTDGDDLNYGIKNFNTRKVDNEDGTTTNYGYYLITLTLDNTLSSLNINSNDSEAGYVKYFKYINGISLIDSPNYFEQLYKQILPFAKVQPTSLLYNITTLQKPIHIELDNRFKQTLCSDKNYVDSNITEVNTVVTTTSSSTGYDRYFGNISPYITQRSSISNQWLLKKKNSNYGMITNGNYPSIGDCVINKTSMSILTEHKYIDYVVSTNKNVKNYNNIEQADGHNKQIDLPENKHFNVSKVVNLPSIIEYKLPSLYTYTQLQELETDEEIYKVFIKANKGTNLTSFTNDEILFLFNRYDYTTSSTPVKLSKDKAAKLYRLKYIFTLK